MLRDRSEAICLLRELGASEGLLVHIQLVGEAAERLMQAYVELGVRFDARLIELGVIVHDVGKILYPGELSAPGSMHECAGEALLLAHGVQSEVARYCVSHAKWQEAGVSFEELSVALADKLWKGKRVEALELRIVDEAASRLRLSRWDVFAQLDAVFEEVADGGTDRLGRVGGS